MKRLKILIVIMIIFLVFLLGYYRGQWEETTTVWVSFPAAWAANISTWDVKDFTWASSNTWVVVDTGETIIYTRADTEKELINNVNKLVGNESISRAIVQECVNQTKDYKLCIKNVIWVSNAESSIFKKGMKPSNNGFGWMYKWKKRRFSSVEESIHLRVAMYVRNGREKRTTGQARISGKYCTSACTWRIRNYNSAIKKLNLD